MPLTGTCHCKATRFEVPAAPETVTFCTCSNCSRRGALWAYYPRADVKILAEDDAGVYQWGWKVGRFHFCRTCGNSTFNETPDFSTGEPNFDNPLVVVNARLFDDFDLDVVPVTVIDGKNLW